MNHLFQLLPQFFRQTWRMMASLLYGVQATDTVTFSGVIGIVGMVATVASLLPAYRATRVDPMVALRND
jgi:putative ABC transport system permease protein